MSTWTSERASTAAYTRAGNLVAADAARQRLKALRAEDYIRRLVDSPPHLTDEQVARLALILCPTTGDVA